MNRIKFLRKKHNLSVRELGEKTNISYSTISRMENSDCQISESNLLELARFFNVSTDYILGRTDTPNMITNEELGDFKFALYGEVKDLTEEEKQEILNYAKYLKSKKLYK